MSTAKSARTTRPRSQRPGASSSPQRAAADHPRPRSESPRSRQPVDPKGASRLDLALEGLIFALIAYLPFAFGGVMPISQIVIVGLAGLIAGLFAIRCFTDPDAPLIASKAFWLLAGLVAVPVVQLIPLPIGLLEFISPSSAAAWNALAEARGESLSTGTISLYPRGTRGDLTLLIGAAILIVVGATIYQRKDAFKRLLAGVGPGRIGHRSSRSRADHFRSRQDLLVLRRSGRPGQLWAICLV